MTSIPSTSAIRSFRAHDIPRVCELFASTFRSGAQHRRAALAESLEATYLGAPNQSETHGSIVHTDTAGRVDGFVGVMNIAMQLGERRLLGGVLGAFMADDPKANPAIGASLARALVGRRPDMMFSDTANRTSLDISRALRFSVLPLQSLEWAKVLRPGGTAAHLLRRRRPGLGRWLAPGIGAVDALLPRFTKHLIDSRSIDGTSDRALAPAAFVEAAPALVRHYRLRPAWDASELSWCLGQAALQSRNGTLHVREIVERGGRRAGLYLLYASKGGVAHALQVLAAPGRESAVIGNLIRHAHECGAVSVRGAASREIVLGLARHPGVFYHHLMSMIAWSADPEVRAAIRSGDVFLGGLAGETWTRIYGDSFA